MKNSSRWRTSWAGSRKTDDGQMGKESRIGAGHPEAGAEYAAGEPALFGHGAESVRLRAGGRQHRGGRRTHLLRPALGAAPLQAGETGHRAGLSSHGVPLRVPPRLRRHAAGHGRMGSGLRHRGGECHQRVGAALCPSNAAGVPARLYGDHPPRCEAADGGEDLPLSAGAGVPAAGACHPAPELCRR